MGNIFRGFASHQPGKNASFFTMLHQTKKSSGFWDTTMSAQRTHQHQLPPSEPPLPVSHTCYSPGEVKKQSGTLVTLLAWAAPSGQKIEYFSSSAANLCNHETQQPTHVYTPPTHQIDADAIKVNAGGVCWPWGWAFVDYKASHHKWQKIMPVDCLLRPSSSINATTSIVQATPMKQTLIISKFSRMGHIWGQGGVISLPINQLFTVTISTRRSIICGGVNVPIMQQCLNWSPWKHFCTHTYCNTMKLIDFVYWRGDRVTLSNHKTLFKWFKFIASIVIIFAMLSQIFSEIQVYLGQFQEDTGSAIIFRYVFT